jgi:two-component system nitrate/nitrite response regulator NarL
MSRILLADDHPMIRTALEALLRGTDFDIVATAATGEDALREYERVEPDILLLDLQMPGGTGMDVIRALSSAGAKVKIVVLTAGIDDASLAEARELGVSGLVLKNSDPAFLLDCLEKVKSGGKWIDSELQARIDELSGSVAAGRRPALAPRERELIRFVSKGLRNREIASELGVTEGTVKVYLHAVFEKLGVSSRTELAVRADEFLAASYFKKS